MPTGPKGEKRPADVIGNAVKVMRIATAEETDELPTMAKTPQPRRSGPKAALRAPLGCRRSSVPISRG
jgi:hypothetical protein